MSTANPTFMHVVALTLAGRSRYYLVSAPDPHTALERAMRAVPSAPEGRYVGLANVAQQGSWNPSGPEVQPC